MVGQTILIWSLIFGLIIIAIVATVIKNKHIAFVKENSLAYNKAIELNKKYQFYNLSWVLRETAVCKSKRGFDNFNVGKFYAELMDNNYIQYREKIRKAEKNREDYIEYLRNYEQLKALFMTEEQVNKLDFRYKTFNKYEMELFQSLLKNKPIVSFKLQIYCYYTSPAGNSHYDYTYKYNYEEIKAGVEDAEQRKHKHNGKSSAQINYESKKDYNDTKTKILNDISFSKLETYLTSPKYYDLQEYLKILSSILNEDELNVLRKTKLNQVKDIHGEMGYNACGKIIVARVIEPIVYELMRNDHIKTALILANQIVSFGNPIDSHFFISNVVNILCSKHEIDNAIGFAKKDFEMRNLYMNNLIINERQIASCPAWKRLIDLYVEKGKFKEAVEICETVIALNPIDINKYNSIIKKLNKEFVGNEQFTIDSENSNIKDEIYPKDKTYVFIDVETAVGFDIICSIGMIILKNGEVIKINQLINPETPISHGNTQIHGIKDEDVKDKPTFINFWKSIEDYKLENIIYVGHNVRFDLRKINEGHKQYGVNDFHSSRIIDTMDVAKKYYYKDNTIQGDLKLDRLADIFGIKFNHHDAMSDIETTKKVLEKLILNYNLDIKALEKKYDPNK